MRIEASTKLCSNYIYPFEPKLLHTDWSPYGHGSLHKSLVQTITTSSNVILHFEDLYFMKF